MLGRSLAGAAFASSALLCAVTSMAQVSVVVTDLTSGAVLPYAHVVLEQAGETLLASAADTRGQVGSGCTPSAVLPLVVRVTHVGYEGARDTMTAPGLLAVRLMRKPFSLGEVVVTGQYAPNTAEAAVHRVRVLDASTFQRMAANNLADVLRNELNIRLAQDNILGTSMGMQGLSGQNVKILVDGVPVIGRMDGNIDLAQLDLSAMERAEIVEGPLSVTYGTNALAGTINLISRKASSDAALLRAGTYAEHIGRFNANVTAAGGTGRNRLLIHAGRNYFAGWDPDRVAGFGLRPQPADTNRHQQWKPREQYIGRIDYRWAGDRWVLGYKGELMHDMILSRGMPRAPYFETAFDERFRTLRMDHVLSAQARFNSDISFNGLLAHNRYSRTRNSWFRDLTTLDEVLRDSPGAQDTSRFELTNVRAVLASARPNARLTWELGVDLVHEQGRGERMEDGRRAIGDHALFGSLEYRLNDRVTIRPGLRQAYNTRYAAPAIPSLNLRWRMDDRLTLRASYAEGFRAPSLKELYFFFVDVNHDITGNAGLEAERSRHANMALQFRDVRQEKVFAAEINLFHNHLRQQIALARVEGNRWSYVNLDELRTAGGSVNAGWEGGRWAISAGGALTARLDALARELNEPWLWTPELRGSLTRQWAGQGLSCSVFWKYTGRQVNYTLQDNVDLVRGSIADYHMADLTLSKHCFRGRLILTAGCKDLFNVQDLDASLAGSVHDAGGASVPMSTGRTLFVKMDLELKRLSTE